jgi:CRP-like cAMP-binding protein
VLLDRDSKVDSISHVPLFSRLSRGELAKVAQLADEVDLPAGKTLIREGERGREFFVLLEGVADVRSNTRLLPSMRAGDFFGEVALVTDHPRTATVTTSTPVRALVITDRAFRQLLRTYPEMQRKVLEAVASRLTNTL